MKNDSATRALWSTRQIASMALLCSIALLLAFIEIPIFPAAPYLKYDASFVPALIGGFAFGPASGVAIGVVEVCLHGLFLGDLPGSLMNALVVVCFVVPASAIYLRWHTRKGAYMGLAVSGVASVLAAIAGNLVITPLYLGVPLDAVVVMILPILLPFNTIKAVANCLLTALVYKSTANVLKPKHERSKARLRDLPRIEPLPPTDVAVSFHDVAFAYGDGTVGLDGVTLAVPRGQFVCILGSNGSGKSTLARHINALLVPDRGTVEVFGASTALPEMVYRIRSTAGLVFQNPSDQMVAASVEEDIAFGPENLGLPSGEIAQRVAEAVRLVGLEGKEQAEPAALSGGERQRVAIAGVLAMRPSILVLDEAGSMLDPKGRSELLRIVAKLRATGMTVIMVTHDVSEAALADRVIVMAKGRVAADGPADDVLCDKELLGRCDIVVERDDIAKCFAMGRTAQADEADAGARGVLLNTAGAVRSDTEGTVQ